MALAFDTASLITVWRVTPAPKTTIHNPIGTPRGIVVLIATVSQNSTISAVTYGGVAMTLVISAVDSAGETGRAYAYFLGSGIPTGTQTVSVTHNADDNQKHGAIISLTANGNTSVIASGKLEGDFANPQIALDSGSVSALRLFATFSGLAQAGLSLLAGETAVGIQQADGDGAHMREDRQTSPSIGSFTVGYTGTIDDVAMVALAVQQSTTDPVADSGRMGGTGAIRRPPRRWDI